MSWQFDFLLQVLHNFSSEKRTTRDSQILTIRPRMISMRGNDGTWMEGVFVSSWTEEEEYGALMTRGEILLN